MSDLQPLTSSIAMPLVPDVGIEGLARRLGKEAIRGDVKAAEKAAKDFESVLLYKLMEEMNRTVPESGLFESGATRQIDGIFPQTINYGDLDYASSDVQQVEVTFRYDRAISLNTRGPGFSSEPES